MQANHVAPIWTIRRSNWFLRFFLWAWKTSPEKLNICKMFWGTLFLPLAVFRRESVVTVAGRVFEVLVVLGAFAGWVTSAVVMALSVIALFGWADSDKAWDASSIVLSIFCLFVFAGISSAMRLYCEEVWTRIGWGERFPAYVVLPFAWLPAKVGSGIAWACRWAPDTYPYYREWSYATPSTREVRIRGPWDVFIAFYHGLKNKYCPRVKVI